MVTQSFLVFIDESFLLFLNTVGKTIVQDLINNFRFTKLYCVSALLFCFGVLFFCLLVCLCVCLFLVCLFLSLLFCFSLFVCVFVCFLFVCFCSFVLFCFVCLFVCVFVCFLLLFFCWNDFVYRNIESPLTPKYFKYFGFYSTFVRQRFRAVIKD